MIQNKLKSGTVIAPISNAMALVLFKQDESNVLMIAVFSPHDIMPCSISFKDLWKLLFLEQGQLNDGLGELRKAFKTNDFSPKHNSVLKLYFRRLKSEDFVRVLTRDLKKALLSLK